MWADVLPTSGKHVAAGRMRSFTRVAATCCISCLRMGMRTDRGDTSPRTTMDISDIRYARSGDLNIAYQRFGAGPDLVIIPGLVSNVELACEHDVYRRAREYVGRDVRVLEFDKRGMARSDRFEQAPTLEQRIDDVQAVMDAEGSSARTSWVSEGGLWDSSSPRCTPSGSTASAS
jgi:hypothetical protein